MKPPSSGPNRIRRTLDFLFLVLCMIMFQVYAELKWDLTWDFACKAWRYVCR